MGSAPAGVRTVVFDIDGTLLDSAAGILAGFQHALRAGDVPVPSEAELRVHLGPPLREFLSIAGVSPDRLDRAAQAYHDFYLAEGLRQARPYAGVEDLLTRLAAAGVTLATASAKRTTTARAILTAHGLADHFAVIGGTDETHLTKAQTIAAVLAELTADPASTIMVGDRRHDIDGAHAVDVAAIGALWGYGVEGELVAAGADWLARDVADSGRLLGV
jgi:phosphoglycolate phosphatase